MSEDAAADALERVERLCKYLDTSSTTMGGKIVAGHAYPDTIRDAIAGGAAWEKFEAWIASRPPGGMNPELRARLVTIVPGETLDLGNGVVLSCE